MLEARRTRLVLIALLVVAIALITIDFRDDGGSPAHSLGGRIFGPVEHLASDVAGVFHGAGNSGQISALQRQNDKLRAELAQAQAFSADNAQLRSLLKLTSGTRYKVVTASVIAAGGAYSDTVTINAGSAAGIRRNETVLNGDGLVGTVVRVTTSTATVQLATDADVTVGVKLAGTGQIGSLSGTAGSMTGATRLRLTMFSATATIKPGDELVTFGSVGGRPYVADIPVGTITQVTSEPGSLSPTAFVHPFVDFTGLGVLGVVISG